MKKILTVSIMAVMAVTAANAEIASKAYVDTQTGQLSTLTTTAKTNLVGAINELNTKAGNVAQQIAAALTPYSTTEQSDAAYATAAQGAKADTAVQSVAEGTTNGTVAVDGTDVPVHGLGTAAYTASTAYDASGTAAGLVGTLSNLTTTDKTNVVAAINEVKGAVSDVDTGVMSVAEGATNGTVAVDGTDVPVHGLGTAAYTASTAYDAAGTAAGVQTALETKIGTLPQGQTSVVGYIDSVKTTADDALVKTDITEGTANGTVAVDGTDVPVHGLGTAAYTASTAYATAEQGTKADSAVQSVTKSGEGNILTGITTTDHAVTVTVSGTAIPQPSGNCTDCVLHYNGTAYSWEEITR